MAQTLEELKERFKTKTGWELNPKNYLFDDEKGLMAFDVTDDCVDVHSVCGDGIYWCNKSIEIAQEHNLNTVKVRFVRNLTAFARLLGFREKLAPSKKNQKTMRIFVNQNGDKAIANYIGVSPKGAYMYDVTLTIKDQLD